MNGVTILHVASVVLMVGGVCVVFSAIWMSLSDDYDLHSMPAKVVKRFLTYSTVGVAIFLLGAAISAYS